MVNVWGGERLGGERLTIVKTGGGAKETHLTLVPAGRRRAASPSEN